MNIVIDNYRIRRFNDLNLCIEEYKPVGKSKNPYGRNGKPKDGVIAQNNESNNIKYKWVVVGYHHYLRFALKQLMELTVSNNESNQTIDDVLNHLQQIEEKIDEILTKYDKPHREDGYSEFALGEEDDFDASDCLREEETFV
jgi:hypothetical protein